MAQAPKWAVDPNGKIPSQYKKIMEAYPDVMDMLRIEEITRKKAKEMMSGVSEHQINTLVAIVSREKPQQNKPKWDRNENFEATKKGPMALPSLRSWDREAEVLPHGLHWEPGEPSSVKDLIDRRTAVFNDLHERKLRKKITRIDVKMHGPIAITHLGDPHVDADGCNWPELVKTVETISKTEGMYAGNIGDTTNNWVGSLQRLYAHQSTTYDEGVQLAEWLLTSVPWVYVILGNHDSWNNGGSLIRQILKNASVATATAGLARIELHFPKGDPIRIMARHDFKGSSTWNRAHGPMKAAKLDPWADVYVSGHKHHWVSHMNEGMDGKPKWSMTVRGYKWHDSFAEEHGFYEHELGASCTTILDPTAKPTERVKLVWDVEEAADLLRFYRKRAGYN